LFGPSQKGTICNSGVKPPKAHYFLKWSIINKMIYPWVLFTTIHGSWIMVLLTMGVFYICKTMDKD
jgi:hypothetical protein